MTTSIINEDEDDDDDDDDDDANVDVAGRRERVFVAATLRWRQQVSIIHCGVFCHLVCATQNNDLEQRSKCIPNWKKYLTACVRL